MRMQTIRGALFATAAAAVMLVAGAPSQAAPIAPLPEAAVQDTSGLTQVWWHYRYHWHHRYWHRWHHHCWRWRCW